MEQENIRINGKRKRNIIDREKCRQRQKIGRQREGWIEKEIFRQYKDNNIDVCGLRELQTGYTGRQSERWADNRNAGRINEEKRM